MWNITLLWLFVVVLSWLYFFFLATAPPAGSTTWRILTVYGINDASSSKDVAFGGLGILSGSNPQKTKKGAWFGIFQLNWQNYKIATSLARNIGSTPNFDRLIEPHSWLREWSRITKFVFKTADRCHMWLPPPTYRGALSEYAALAMPRLAHISGRAAW